MSKRPNKPPEPPFPPVQPEEFISWKEFVTVSSGLERDSNDNIPLEQLVQLYNKVQPTLKPDETLVVLLEGFSYDGEIYGGVGYYKTQTRRTPYYERNLKLYKRAFEQYLALQEQYEKELKAWNDETEKRRKEELRHKISEAKKLLKEHGEL